MAKKNAETAARPQKKTKCFGLVAHYFNGGVGGHYAQPGQGPHVIFDKTSEALLQRQKSYIKDGDVVIEFQEVARYKIKNVVPSLEPVGEKREAE